MAAFDRKRGIVFLLGLVFIVSAGGKLLDPQVFYVQLSSYGIIREPLWVQLAGAGLITLEWGLGLGLLFNFNLRNATLWAAFGMLAGFSGMLAYGWLVKGLTDCGCFGSLVSMSPQTALIKNLVLIGLAAAALTWSKKSDEFDGKPVSRHAPLPLRFAAWIILCFPLLGLLRGSPPTDQPPASTAETIAAQSPFAKFRLQADDRVLDLGQGRYLIAMLSDSCEHCAASVPRLNAAHDAAGDETAVVALCLGDPDTMEAFKRKTRPRFSVQLIKPLEFFNLIGNAPPRFYLVENGEPVQHWDDTLPANIVKLMSAHNNAASP